MVISYSEARQFRLCQRKWFFKNVLASWNAKDPIRREAFVLSKLQSLGAWRGSIVDKVLSDVLLPRLQQRQACTTDTIINAARAIFDAQRQFAASHRIREVGF